MSCSCYRCASQAHPESTQCPDTINQGPLVALDENCSLRTLVGQSGIVNVDSAGDASITDGSDDRGSIVLKPETANALNNILGLTQNGTLVSIADEATEGQSLIRQGGKWVPASQADLGNTYKQDQIRAGNGKIAAFICASNGTVQLGYYDACRDGLIIFDENGDPVCNSIDNLSAKLLLGLCKAATVVLDTDTVKGDLVCTELGIKIRKNSTGDLWLTTPILAYYQTKHYPGWPGAAVQVVNIPPTPPSQPGFWSDGFVDFDVEGVPGYDPRFTRVRFNVMMKGFGGNGSFDMVLSIGGMEYSRIAFIGGFPVGANFNQVVVPIPVSKKIRIQANRQNSSGSGGSDEVSGVAVWCQELIS